MGSALLMAFVRGQEFSSASRISSDFTCEGLSMSRRAVLDTLV